MKSKKTALVIASIVLCGLGAWLALSSPYREKTYLVNTGTCKLETTAVEKRETMTQGTVVLFHGISANKRIMSYLARGFAEQNLRVYVPDFPGHGHGAGPFSVERSEECGEALVQKLLASGLADPNRMIIAGHSMGGAIALRVGARVPVAGVVAFSPAPMKVAHGVSPEILLVKDPGPLPKHFLVISGTLEPEGMRGNAADLVSSRHDGTAQYIEIPRTTHVSMLFSSAVLHAAQNWTRQTLQLTGTGGTPSLRQLYGALAGLFGLLLLANPFLREITGKKENKQEAGTGNAVPLGRMLLVFAGAALLAVTLLHFWKPVPLVRVFQGDYLATFLLLVGTLLLLSRWKGLSEQLPRKSRGALGAAVGGLIIFLLFTAWFELSLYEAWLTLAKWARFLFLFVMLLPYHFAEEIFLGPVASRKGWHRLGAGLTLRIVAWCALVLGVLYLHSGEILMVLLAPYFVLVQALQRRGMDIVREETGSAAATAVFGAILLAGFCLVIFPIT
ncbi:MAG TPA: alpha/beta fold hydrolase [Methylomirabilota bacterium]|nr:alpha/beta fold hydrolase [Methylomirabilota bacterium]